MGIYTSSMLIALNRPCLIRAESIFEGIVMKDKTEIIVLDNWKVVKVNSLNWQVFELKEVGKPVGDDMPSREGELAWYSHEAYFATPAYAVLYIWNHCADNLGKQTIKSFVAEMGKMADTIIRQVGKAKI